MLRAIARTTFVAALVLPGAMHAYGCVISDDLKGTGVIDAGPDGADGADAREAAVIEAGTQDVTPRADAGPPWTLYSRSRNVDQNRWHSVPLDAAWIGPNAPPPNGIRAVTQLDAFDRLLVFADDGMFYLRDPSGWRTPRPIADVFGSTLAGVDFRGPGHVRPAPDAGANEQYETLLFSANPTAIIYKYFPTDSVQFLETVALVDEPGPYGAPKGTGKLRWNVVYFDPARYQTAQAAQYLQLYYGFDADPYVYLYDATLAPANKWLYADSPLFAGTTDAPPPDRIMAGWNDDAPRVTYFVVR